MFHRARGALCFSESNLNVRTQLKRSLTADPECEFVILSFQVN